MEIIIQDSAADAATYAAEVIAAQIRRRLGSVLGFATGSTPEPVYAELVRLHKEQDLNFSRISSFNLDEYVGLPPDDKQSYHYYMRKHLFDHVNIDTSHTHFPDGMAADVPQACQRYEDLIVQAGGIDLQLLGIGRDGHIGFNEPTSSLASRTRIKTLTEETVEDNARFFGAKEKVPYHVVTMGIGTIREARCILMLALGASKADAVAAMVEGSVASMVPASVLQLHESVIVVLDAAAASKLQRADYYRWVFERKPDWQNLVPPGQ